jgi:hypothetical protein
MLFYFSVQDEVLRCLGGEIFLLCFLDCAWFYAFTNEFSIYLKAKIKKLRAATTEAPRRCALHRGESSDKKKNMGKVLL